MTRRPIITDHAVLRYLERVVGIDVEAHRRAMEMKTEDAVVRGACALVSDGFRYKISDDRVVTVARRRSINQRPERMRDEE